MHSSPLILAAVLVVDEPTIEGDIGLLRVVLDAQRANLSSFKAGELRATHRTIPRSSSKSPYIVSTHLIWQGDRAYWEYDVKNDVFDEHGNKIDETPFYARLLFNGANYVLSRPTARSGEVAIFTAANLDEMVGAALVKIDVRPQARWSHLGGIRPWAELLDPHQNLPNRKLEKWTVRSKGDLVIVERHDRDSADDVLVSTIVASLEFHGHVVESTSKGANYTAQTKYSWKKDDAGRAVLEKEWSRTKRAKGTSEEELVITHFDGNSTIKPDQFELSALQIRRGAVVDDRISGRRYTYGGRAVDEQILKSLAQQIQTSRESR